MDPERFDALVQTLSTAGTRRRALRLLTGALAALGGPSVLDQSTAASKTRQKSAHASAKPKPLKPTTSKAPAEIGPQKRHHKKKCKPPCGDCQQCIKKVCRPVPDGTACASGTCTGGACFSSGGGNCTVGNDGSVAVAVEAQFQGQTLRLEQTVQPFGNHGATASRIALTLDGAPLLTQDVTGAGGSVTVTVTYGDAFGGIRQARFTNDGTTSTGEIDGRTIMPLPAGADPSQVAFADGGPPPQVQLDPDLAEAIQALLKQAESGSAGCQSPQATTGRARRGNHPRHAVGAAPARAGKRRRHAVAAAVAPVGQTNPYLICPGRVQYCLIAASSCEGAVVTGCALSLFGYALCVAAGDGICATATEACRRNFLFDSFCCTERCGGDPKDHLFGADPGCCNLSESCLNPDDNQSLCCPTMSIACAGVCCPTGACLGGSCCEPPNNVCGSTCCPPLNDCCAGVCCSGVCCNDSCCEGTCTNGVCCTGNSFPCGNGCCDTVCCNGTCCPAGAACQNGACVQVCTATQFSCDCNGGCTPRCCDSSQFTDCCSWGCGVNACTR